MGWIGSGSLLQEENRSGEVWLRRGSPWQIPRRYSLHEEGMGAAEQWVGKEFSHVEGWATRRYCYRQGKSKWKAGVERILLTTLEDFVTVCQHLTRPLVWVVIKIFSFFTLDNFYINMFSRAFSQPPCYSDCMCLQAGFPFSHLL